MARINKGCCPSCFKDRELLTLQFGIIRATMCVYCLDRYLSQCVIPMIEKNNNIHDDNYISEGLKNETK